MSLDQNHVNRILGAARARDVAKVEELWIDLQSTEGSVNELKFFLSVASEVASRGDKEKAAELLMLLRHDLKEAEKHEELFSVLRQAVEYSPRVKGVRGDLVEAYKHKYQDRPGLEALISRTDLAGEGKVDEAVRQLDEAFFFSEGDFVFHTRGWNVGKVVETSPETGELVIDFALRRGQRMDAGMALKALERRSEDDLDVMLWVDPERVRTLAKEDPLQLLRAALESSDGKLQSRILREKLTVLLEKSGWTKFWNKARKLAKDDPRIEVGSGPRATISTRDTPLAREDEIAARLKQLRAFKDRLAIARSELVSLRKDNSSEPPSWLAKALEQLTRGHGKSAHAKRAAQVELALFKNEVVDQWPETLPDISAKGEDGGIDPETGEPLPAQVPEHLKTALDALGGDLLPPVLSEVTIAEYRKQVVRLIARMSPKDAPENLESILLDPAAQTWPVAAEELKKLGRDDVILAAVTKVLITPEDYPEALAAFARARLTGSLDILPERRDSEILSKAISVFDTVNLEFKGSTDRKVKARLKTTVEALRTLISEKNQRVIKNVVENGTEDEVRRVLQLVRQSPTLTPTIKRACEKYVAPRFPELLATVATTRRDDEDVDDTLYSTVEGIRRREEELNEIMHVKMEEVRLEIGRALEFGDISENAELDAARERQQRLAEQATRMQDELSRVSVIDPAQIKTDEVRIGTRVSVTNLDDDTPAEYSLLGPWDLDDNDDTLISYMSALAVGLMGAGPDDERTIELPGGKTARYRVNSIGPALTVEDSV